MMARKSDGRIIASYILLAVIQIVICNYVFLGPAVVVTLLPVAVMFLPLSLRTETTMLIAFCTGLAVDWLCDGVLGLNAAALVPVALVQKPVIRLFAGEDTVVRQERLAAVKTGWPKVLAAATTLLSLFLAVYIFFDGAGTRTFLFNLMRFALSLAASLPAAALVIHSFSGQERGAYDS